jgi:hypothetical protein
MRARLRSWRRRINALQHLPDDHRQTGHGVLPTTTSNPTGRLPISFAIFRLAQAGRASNNKALRESPV